MVIFYNPIVVSAHFIVIIEFFQVPKVLPPLDVWNKRVN